MPGSMLSVSSVQSSVSLPPCLPCAGVPWLDPDSLLLLSLDPPHAATNSERARTAPKVRVHVEDRRMQRPFNDVELLRVIGERKSESVTTTWCPSGSARPAGRRLRG